MIGLLNLDRVIGLVLGFMLAWAVLAGVNQFIWLPAELERGRDIERTATLEKSIELLKQRSLTNAQIRDLDSRALCLRLGGEWVQNSCQ